MPGIWGAAVRGRWLQRLGLARRDVRAWAMYDWANSAFVTTIVAAVFPVYFSTVAAAGLPPAVATRRFALATTLALAIIAVLAPLLGALADAAGWKKRLLGGFLIIGVAATAAMGAVQRGQWVAAALLFGIANIGAWGTFVFYDSLLPHLAHSDTEMDRASTAGYALGYLGGGLMLALNLAWISWPEVFGFADSASAARASFVSVALWWAVFSIPLFRHVPEPAVRGEPGMVRSLASASALAKGLAQTFRDLRRYREALLFLLAFLVYNDGIGTVIRMAAIYGAEIGLPQRSLLAAILLVQVIGVPCAVGFGGLAVRVGIKPAILFSLAVYLVISIIGGLLSKSWHFYLLAVLVGSVQGGSQALSRSLFARLIPRARSAEFFAFFSISDKVAGVLGPAVFAGVSSLTGTSRAGVMVVGLFFVAGALLLTRVDIEAGERAVAAGNRDASVVGGSQSPSLP